MNISEITSRIMDGGMLSQDEALAIVSETDKEALYEAAHQVTRHFMADKFDTCSIVNAKSGNCSEDCKWCAQSRYYQTKVRLYPLLSEEECVRHAVHNCSQGIGRFAMVTSGKRVSDKEICRIADIVRSIRKESGIKCCASMGLLSREQLKVLRDSGVENYHCNIETAPSYFGNLCTTHTIEDKMQTIRAARELGFRICCGGIVGMGETMAQRIEMACFLREAGIRSIPINLLHPIPGTPLQDAPGLTEEEWLTTVAIFRLINPQAYLRFSGGRAQLSEDTQRKSLYIGINAAIIGDLLTTIGSKVEDDRRLFQEAGYSLTGQTDWIG